MISRLKSILKEKRSILLFLLVLLYIIFVVYHLRGMYYKDAGFPVTGYSSELHDNLVYSWTDRLLGADTFLDKIRGASLFIFNYLGILSPFPYYLVIFIIGVFSTYKFLSLFPSLSKFGRVGISLFYVLNPFTILHITHYLILQGYLITPLIIYFYIRYMSSSKVLSIYPSLILITTLFLGQPHNFANIFFILAGIGLFYIFYKIKNFKESFLKNIILLAGGVLLYSFVYFPFLFSGRTSAIVDSSKHFGSSLPNNTWSSNSTLIDVFSITSNTKFYEHFFYNNTGNVKWIFFFIGTLSFILLLYIVFCYILKRKKNIIEKYVIAGFVISILIVLIHKFNFIVVSDIIYTILPHIKVSTDYGICIFLLVLITIFANINKAIVYIYIFLIQILILLTLFTSPFFSIDRTLLHSLAQHVRLFESTTTDGYTLVLPLAAKHSFSGMNSPISLLILGFDNFTIRHLTVEQMFSKTRASIIDFLRNDNNGIFVNYPFKHFISYSNDPLIDYGIGSGHLVLEKNYGSFQSYTNTSYPGLFTHSDSGSTIFVNRQNPVKYLVYIKGLKNPQDFSFLESFNIHWAFYLGEPSIKNCIEKENSSVKQDGVQVVNCNSKKEGINFNELENFLYSGKEKLLDSTHGLYMNYGNTWMLSRDDITKKVRNIGVIPGGYPRTLDDGRIDYKYYIENLDGSIDVELTLYFRPQLYFYIGLIISGTTLAILIISLIVISLHDRCIRRAEVSTER